MVYATTENGWAFKTALVLEAANMATVEGAACSIGAERIAMNRAVNCAALNDWQGHVVWSAAVDFLKHGHSCQWQEWKSEEWMIFPASRVLSFSAADDDVPF